jgi:catechol 2,3-dioxygenase-like lactoylglutathione lyase family enzyme
VKSNREPQFVCIDHVQFAMPAGQEAVAREFFCGVLGMAEIPKPAELAKRGGCWFQAGNVQVHLGVETDFRPAKKAHPALRCKNYDALLANLAASGLRAEDASDIPGVRRCHIHDPFGNRIELVCGD